MLPLRPGCIIEAEIVDLNGHKKKRPAVIASEIPENEDGPIVVFAITGKFKSPQQPNEIPLSAHPDGKLGTHMKKDCVVACWWPNVICRSDILDRYGELSVPQIRIMTHFFRNLKPQLLPKGKP